MIFKLMAFKFICSNEGLKPQGQFQTNLLQINSSLVDGFLISSKIVSCLLARGVNIQKVWIRNLQKLKIVAKIIKVVYKLRYTCICESLTDLIIHYSVTDVLSFNQSLLKNVEAEINRNMEKSFALEYMYFILHVLKLR